MQIFQDIQGVSRRPSCVNFPSPSYHSFLLGLSGADNTRTSKLGKNTDDDYVYFYFKTLRKYTIYIYIDILIYDLIAQKQSFHSVSVTLRWVPCPS